MEPLSAEHGIGSFTEVGPWVVDPDSMPWRVGVDALRCDAAARVPLLIRRRRLPPLRGATIIVRFAQAVVPWWIQNKLRRRRSKAQPELAAVLRPTFEKLGCTFIKLGQLIASGEGMIPDAWVEEFKSCRDRVPPEGFAHVRSVIEEDFGRPLDAVFTSFDPVPMASASIAQVHLARLSTGQDVVVKVQRPRINDVVAKDIATMAWLAPIVARFSAQAAFANLPAYIEMFADTIVEELDFRLEAQNMLDVAHVLATVESRSIIVPRPHPELVTRRVLVMERLDGHAIDDEGALAQAGIDPAPVFRTLLVSFLEGAMIHGVFHGDLHAGNMVVDSDSRLAIYDFGITGRFSEQKRRALLGLMFSIVGQDGTALLGHFRDLGGFPPNADIKTIGDELQIDDLIRQSPGDVPVQEMAIQMRETLNRLVAHGAKLPKELFLYMKGMVYLSGAIARVAADIDMSAEIAHIFGIFTTDHAKELGAIDIDVEALGDGDAMAERMRQQMGIDDGASMTFRDMRQAQQAQAAELRAARKR